MFSGTKSSWRPEISKMDRSSIWFNIFLNDLGEGPECTKVGGVVDMPESCAAIQRDLDRLEKLAELLGTSFCSTRGSAESQTSKKRTHTPVHTGGQPAEKKFYTPFNSPDCYF